MIGMSLKTPERIRKFQRKLYRKAKKEPEFRFYALYDKIYREDILKYAFRVAKQKDGAPGVDGKSFADIESEGEEDWIRGLQKELQEKTYEPSPVRRVMIEKEGGGKRPLGIPTIRDRVVQTAAVIVHEPIFEADFVESAHGYRPDHSAQQAVEEVHEALCEGYTDVVDADLSAYFDTIPHDELMKSVARRVSDGAVLELIKKWLKVPVKVEDDDGGPRMKGGKKRKEGTPQGGVISPLLANIYMHRYLKYWNQKKMGEKLEARIVNYADDFVILTRGHAKEALEWTRKVMNAIGLSLNQEKTCIKDGSKEHFCFLGYTFGPECYRKKGSWYIAAKPSCRAIQRLEKAIREKLSGTSRAWEEIVESLNDTLRGWANYFSYGSQWKAYRAVDNYVYDAVVNFLSRRHRITTRGRKVFPAEVVFGQLGVKRLVGNSEA